MIETAVAFLVGVIGIFLAIFTKHWLIGIVCVIFAWLGIESMTEDIGNENLDAMAQVKCQYRIHCSPGDWWYITFTDPNGAERFFPIRKRLFGFGIWTALNCPMANGVGHRDDVFKVMDPGANGDSDDITPEQILKNFRERYPAPEDFLKKINLK